MRLPTTSEKAWILLIASCTGVIVSYDIAVISENRRGVDNTPLETLTATARRVFNGNKKLKYISLAMAIGGLIHLYADEKYDPFRPIGAILDKVL
jgi:hypothetical protein